MHKPIPELGKTYTSFDDGKINSSRAFGVIIQKIIPFKDITKEVLGIWQEEVDTCTWLYAKQTDFFIEGELSIGEGDTTQVFYVRTHEGEWFSLGYWAGKLDVDGNLEELRKMYED